VANDEPDMSLTVSHSHVINAQKITIFGMGNMFELPCFILARPVIKLRNIHKTRATQILDLGLAGMERSGPSVGSEI